MYYTTAFEQISADNLSLTRWTVIALSGMRFELDSYEVYQRKTKRHAWRIVNAWYRLEQRRNTVEKPNIPVVVKYGVRKLIYDAIEFI